LSTPSVSPAWNPVYLTQDSTPHLDPMDNISQTRAVVKHFCALGVPMPGVEATAGYLRCESDRLKARFRTCGAIHPRR
jgi:hypothetical protein